MDRFVRCLVVVAAVALVAAAPAGAHSLAEKPARKAAAAETKKIARKTEATKARVTWCERLRRHAWLCTAELKYAADDARCVLPITLSYKSHASTRIRRKVGATTCY